MLTLEEEEALVLGPGALPAFHRLREKQIDDGTESFPRCRKCRDLSRWMLIQCLHRVF